MCWYKTAEEKAAGKRRCIESYSQENGAIFGWSQVNTPPTLEDYERNGQYCKSGLAYGEGDVATCVSTKEIVFEGEVLSAEEHWPCDPTDPYEKCKIVFEKTEIGADGNAALGEFGVDCKCSMSS